MYRRINYIFCFRSVGGDQVDAASYDILYELSTICSLCNDSGIDYNEASRFFNLV